MPGEDTYSWSVTAANNGNSDTSINWAEGQPRASVNNSARSQMAAHAKQRELTSGRIQTTGSSTAYSITTGIGYGGTLPTGLRMLVKVHSSNVGDSNLTVDGFGPVQIINKQGGILVAGDLLINFFAEFIFNGVNWILLNGNRDPSTDRVAKAGDTMTGPLTLANANLEISGGGSISIDAPSASSAVIFTNVTGTRQWYSGTAANGHYSIVDQTGGVTGLDLTPGGGVAAFTGGLSCSSLSATLDVSAGRNLGVSNTAFIAALSVSGTSTLSGAVTAGAVNCSSDISTSTACVANRFSAADYIIVGNTGLKPGGGPWADSSDARIKNVVGNYTDGMAAVTQLRPVRYTFKGNDTMTVDGSSPHQAVIGQEFIGMIAQDVEPHMPEMVKQRSGYIDGAAVSDIRTLDTTALIFALVNCVKELLQRIEALEAKA